MEKAVVIDIDGVILDTEGIIKEIYELKLHGSPMWDHFYANCNGKKALFLQNIIPLLECLKDTVHIFISTARNERVREKTENRLKSEKIPYEKIYMRNIGDFRSSPNVKEDHLDQIQQEYEIIAFIDDDLTNCEMARDKGILALRKV